MHGQSFSMSYAKQILSKRYLILLMHLTAGTATYKKWIRTFRMIDRCSHFLLTFPQNFSTHEIPT